MTIPLSSSWKNNKINEHVYDMIVFENIKHVGHFTGVNKQQKRIYNSSIAQSKSNMIVFITK